MRLLDPLETATRPLAPPDSAGRYEAPVAGGVLRLALETVSDQAPGCAAEAAVRLALAEPLLVTLEAWLAEAAPPEPAPEWAWCASAAGSSLPAGVAEARWAGVGVGARLALPWALLRRLPAPPASLGLQWSPVAAHCLLAAPRLDAPSRDALEPGGVLLLADSFEPGSRPRFCAADEFALPADTLDGERWEVRVGVPEALQPECLLGWHGEPTPPDPDMPLTLWRLAAGRPPQAWAKGRRVPWGDGLAMLVDHVETAPDLVA